MSTSKIIVLAVLIAVFILLVAIDGRRKVRRKKEQMKNEASGDASVL